ncbi:MULTISPECIES: PspC domain-containing protein [Lactobacillus]|uniref:PspC domain-containing protein n=1 Tax=Lactobacillus xujianguonis TaxID=2495899 RepID=A0A437SUI4_9LACO|nr:MULTISPECIES: PspC domain-containing protein [Lactobacillus]RVU70599.1 PspC domain-containing protein [Lactobacillus xujianguonis]RVU72432.1 PspC domain-containing protein [Lactobacillus xujianguonis]
MKKRLTKSQNKIVSGVLGGIANYFDWDPAIVRIVGAAIIIFSGFFPGLILYIVAAIVMPDADSRDNTMDGSFRKE